MRIIWAIILLLLTIVFVVFAVMGLYWHLFFIAACPAYLFIQELSQLNERKY